MDRFLNAVEVAGNKLPDPATLFIILAVIVIILSAIFGSMGVSAVHPGTGKEIKVVNLLTVDGFRMMWSKAVTNFSTFAPLGMVLVCVLGAGVAEKSGFLAAFMQKMLGDAAPALVTWVIIFIGINGNVRNNAFKKDGVDYHAAADLTGQANHLGVTIKADIVKQKLPVNNGGFTAIKFGKTNDKVYTELTSEHPIDLCRYQVANGYMGRVGLINSGGESHGSSDLKDAIITAIVNKRAGGMGLISGRKAFQKPMKDGIELLNTIQDVYLDSSITIA